MGGLLRGQGEGAARAVVRELGLGLRTKDVELGLRTKDVELGAGGWGLGDDFQP
jgi:hypothetical protein